MRYFGIVTGTLLLAVGFTALALNWFSHVAYAAVAIGLGCGFFGHHLGILLQDWAAKKDPALARRTEIEQKDERNIRLNDAAKSRAFDHMSFIHGTVLLVLVLIKKDLTVVLLLVGAYVLSYISMFYYLNKLNKEM